jgi:uncharacterized YigZ family protein
VKIVLMTNEVYYTVERMTTAEFKDRGSRFIAYACPVKTSDDFKATLNAIKKDHPKATHYCFAYRIGLDGNQFRVSDGGEPSGSAGRPILGQIDSKALVNVLVVVVRYFGGTLLGVPGLIHAYRSAAALALQLTPRMEKQVEQVFKIHFDYTQMNEVMMVVRQYNCRIIKQDIQLFCDMVLAIPKNRVAEVLYKLQEMRNIEISPVQG